MYKQERKEVNVMIVLKDANSVLLSYSEHGEQRTLESIEKEIRYRKGLNPDTKIIVVGGLLYNDNDSTREIRETLIKNFPECNREYLGNISTNDIMIAYEIE